MSSESIKVPKIREDPTTGKKYVTINTKKVWLGKNVTQKEIIKHLLKRKRRKAAKKAKKATKKAKRKARKVDALFPPGANANTAMARSFTGDPSKPVIVTVSNPAPTNAPTPLQVNNSSDQRVAELKKELTAMKALMAPAQVVDGVAYNHQQAKQIQGYNKHVQKQTSSAELAKKNAQAAAEAAEAEKRNAQRKEKKAKLKEEIADLKLKKKLAEEQFAVDAKKDFTERAKRMQSVNKTINKKKATASNLVRHFAAKSGHEYRKLDDSILPVAKWVGEQAQSDPRGKKYFGRITKSSRNLREMDEKLKKLNTELEGVREERSPEPRVTVEEVEDESVPFNKSASSVGVDEAYEPYYGPPAAASVRSGTSKKRDIKLPVVISSAATSSNSGMMTRGQKQKIEVAALQQKMNLVDAEYNTRIDEVNDYLQKLLDKHVADNNGVPDEQFTRSNIEYSEGIIEDLEKERTKAKSELLNPVVPSVTATSQMSLDELMARPDAPQNAVEENPPQVEGNYVDDDAQRVADPVWDISQLGDGRKKGNDDPGLSTEQINELMKGYPLYLGCIARNEVDTLDIKPQSRFGFVMNTDPNTRAGVHWVAIYVDARDVGDHSFEYYNSLADQPTASIIRSINKVIEKLDPALNLTFKVNKIADQSEDSSNCGYFACKFLIDRFKGDSFAKASGYKQQYPVGEANIEKWKRKLGIEPFEFFEDGGLHRPRGKPFVEHRRGRGGRR